MSKSNVKSIPEMMRLVTYQENRNAVMLAIPVGLSFPLVGYLVMHPFGPVGGSGAWGQEGVVAWASRVVALACLAVSGPKVFDWLSVMFGAQRDTGGDFPWTFKRFTALAAAVAVELTVFLIPDPFISGYMLLMSSVMNAYSVACSTVADHKAVEAARKVEDAGSVGDTLFSGFASQMVNRPLPSRTIRMVEGEQDRPGKGPGRPVVRRNRGPASKAKAVPKKRKATVRRAA